MKIISSENLSVGQTVTVLNWKNHPEDSSYFGDALFIKSINLPFIVVKPTGRAFPIDTRTVDLMELSEDYVDAISGE